MDPQPPPNVIAQLLPLSLLCVALYFFLVRIAKRKGRSPLVALFAFLPFANGLYALWLCSQTDEAILKRIDALEKLNKLS
jgi:hypothetical protein